MKRGRAKARWNEQANQNARPKSEPKSFRQRGTAAYVAHDERNFRDGLYGRAYRRSQQSEVSCVRRATSSNARALSEEGESRAHPDVSHYQHKDPKTVMRYDHGRENLDQSAVNFLDYSESE